MERMNLSELDPLTRMAASELEGNDFVQGKFRSSKDSFEPWAVKKMAILTKFTTQEKLSITTSVYSPSSSHSANSSGKCCTAWISDI